MPIRTVLIAGSSHVRPRPLATDIALIALLTVVVTAILATGAPSWTRLAAAWWLACALLLAYSDAITHRVSLGLIAMMSAGTLALLAGTGDTTSLLRSLLVGAVLALSMLVLCLPRDGLGLGDAALAFPIGLMLGWTGWSAVVLWVLGAGLLSSLTATTLLALHRATRHTLLPLGPFLLFAVVPAVVFQGRF
jgi:leader peptidase (prepilin peptidase) / N-methyltransferase